MKWVSIPKKVMEEERSSMEKGRTIRFQIEDIKKEVNVEKKIQLPEVIT